MNPSNLQGHMPRQVGGQPSNDNQSYMRQNVPPGQNIHPQYYGQQYQHPQYPIQPQQHSYHQYGAGSQYGGQHPLQQQNLPQSSGYQSQSNMYQQQVPRYQDRPVLHQVPIRNDQQFQTTGHRGPGYNAQMSDRTFSGPQQLPPDPNRHIPLQQQDRSHEGKMMTQNPGQRMPNQGYDYIPENAFASDPSRQLNRPHQLPPSMYYGGLGKPETKERQIIEGKRESLDNMTEEQRRKLNMSRSLQGKQTEYQPNTGYSNINQNLSNDIKNLQRIPGQIGLIHYSMLSQTGQSHHPLIRREDIDPEYEKAVKKLKENEKKIKILLERQQMDGKISDAKERIEKLERIIQFKEKASLNYINRFINATDAKIKDENLCKPVIDAFDHIVKAGDKYKNFRIPHYDPFYCIKEKLGVPDYIKYARPDDDTDPTPYYLRETNCDDVKEKIIERSGEKEKSTDVSKINVGERELEILEEIDEKSKLVIGEDSKEHLVILCGNERYLVLSEIITKDLKSCGGKFKVDPESIPISDHCREINIIITFDTIGVPPLHLLVPIDYPKDFCTIINPNFNEVDRDVLLCRLISKVEQALPCLPINRDIQNIVNTWKKLSMTCN